MLGEYIIEYNISTHLFTVCMATDPKRRLMSIFMPNVPEKQWDEISCWEAFEWRFDVIAKKFGELLSDNYVVSISDDDIVFNKIDDGNDGMCVYLGVETFCNALSDLQITELI